MVVKLYSFFLFFFLIHLLSCTNTGDVYKGNVGGFHCHRIRLRVKIEAEIILYVIYILFLIHLLPGKDAGDVYKGDVGGFHSHPIRLRVKFHGG